MNPMETAKVCFLLGSGFPAWRVKDETVETWHIMLQDLDASVVLHVANQWILTEEKNPTIAGIRRKCAEITGELAPTAFQAWEEVTEALNAHGRDFYRNGGTWSHPLIAKTVKAVGFSALCFSETIGVERAHFIKAYEDAKKQDDQAVITSIGFRVGTGVVALGNSSVVELEQPRNQMRAI